MRVYAGPCGSGGVDDNQLSLLVAVKPAIVQQLRDLAQEDYEDILERDGLRFMPCVTVVWTHAVMKIPDEEDGIPCWEAK